MTASENCGGHRGLVLPAWGNASFYLPPWWHSGGTTKFYVTREEYEPEVAFLRLERRVLTAKEAPLSEIPAVLDAVKEFAGREKLTAQHLRMASSTVALINRLESLEDREQRFTELGDLFAKSTDKELSRYGRKIAKNTANK